MPFPSAVLTALLMLVCAGPVAAANAARVPSLPEHTSGPADELSPGDGFTEAIAGILPFCPVGYGDDANTAPLTNPAPEDAYDELGAQALFGLGYNCADQDWNEMGNAGTDFTREATAQASPDTVSISDHTTQVTFSAASGDMTGPYNSDLYTCFPTASFGGGCSTATQTSDAPDPNTSSSFDLVAVRSANSAGLFVGQWTLLDSSNNPWFDFTKSSGCENNWSDWSAGYFTTGFPCTYTLRFATDTGGLPTLTKSLEVIIGFELYSGNETASPFGEPITSWQYNSYIAVPMLFQAGGSTKLTLAASPGKVTYDQPVTLTADASGPGKGTAISFLAALAGTTHFTPVASGSTDSAGIAKATVKPAKNTDYEAKIVGTGVGASVTSKIASVEVVPKLSASGRLSGSKATFTGTVAPASTVLLEQQRHGRWTTVSRLTPDAKGEIKTSRTVPKGRSTWRLSVPASSSLLQADSASIHLDRH